MQLQKPLTRSPVAEPARPRPAWLAALDGLCLPCADAEFYGLRMKHAYCTRGDCCCSYTIPAVWPEGTWPCSALAAIVAFLLALTFQAASISKGTFLTPHTMLYLGLVFLAVHLVYPWSPWRRAA